MKIKRINYTKEEATNLYLNTYRYKILEELKVQEIQKRVINKILKVNDNNNLYLIFYKNNISGFNLSDMSGLLSKECSIIEENNISEDEDMEEDIKLYKRLKTINKYIDIEEDKNISEDEDMEEDKNMEEDKDMEEDKNMEEDIKLYKRLKTINKYIDIEAECSSEDGDIEKIDELSDQSFICDEEMGEDKTPSLYFEQKEQEDDKIIRRLQNKFKKRKPTELEKVHIEIEESDEIDQGFSEMDIETEVVKFNKEEFENIKEEEGIFYEEFTVEFNNMGLVEKKMNNKSHQK
jgi:hypothetical protein